MAECLSHSITILRSLKRAATRACTWRGHKFSRRWEDRIVGTNMLAATRHCEQCGMSVHVETHPPPNGIDLGGEAVAMNCRAVPGTLPPRARAV